MELDNDIICSASQYFKAIGKKIDWEETGDPKKVPMVQYELAEKIIVFQVSFWALRRLGKSDQSMSERMWTILNETITEYESIYGKFENKSPDLW